MGTIPGSPAFIWQARESEGPMKTIREKFRFVLLVLSS